MDAIDLLAREDEFKKLNKQLEKKSESLMKQIELVLQKQDTLPEFSTKNARRHSCEQTQITSQVIVKTPKNTRSLEPTRLTKHSTNDSGPNVCSRDNVCNCCIQPNNDMEFLYAFVSVHIKDKILPQSFNKDNITVEKVCKYMSSKIKILQEEVDKQQNKINIKTTQCESHLTQLADLENERMSLLNKTNNMKTATIEMKAKCHALQNRLDEKDRLCKDQRSQIDKLSCELKRLKSKAVSSEARCASQEETIDNLRQQIDTLKVNEKELRDSSRSLSASNQTRISNLETHINIQNKQIDRQTKLINNLRKQNHLLAMNGAFKNLEQDYNRLLTE